MVDRDAERDAFAERLFQSALGYFDVLSIRLGQRLGLYEALAEGSATSQELAARAGVAERYAREWLEQQTTALIIVADVERDPVTFTLPAGHAGAGNRPVFLTTLPNDWLPRIPPLHDRLRVDPPARVLDVGCGTGWSSIAIAKAYPSVSVDGVDPDEISIELARKNAAAEGVADRVRFHREDAALVERAPFDVAAAFECVHDMARPVQVLAAVRASLADEGAMLVVDERTRDRFTGEPDPLEQYFYGWSVFDCLPTGMHEQPSAGTGTVMRASTLERYAREAGFTRFEALPIEHDTFRLYLLRP